DDATGRHRCEIVAKLDLGQFVRLARAGDILSKNGAPNAPDEPVLLRTMSFRRYHENPIPQRCTRAVMRPTHYLRVERRSPSRSRAVMTLAHHFGDGADDDRFGVGSRFDSIGETKMQRSAYG